MQFPLLRLVTPASANDSVNSFTDELKNLGWVWQGGNKNLDFNPAGTTAQQAVTDVKNALELIPIKPAVIVTAGLAATTAVSQAGGNAVPAIVQAAGGGLPNPIPNNVTGFVLNPLGRPYGTSNDQLQRLVGMSPNAMYIAVLYDSTNGVSTTGAFAALQALAPTLNPPPNIVPLDVNGGNLQQFFKVQKLLNNPNPPCTGFMLLPNAQFYDKQARHHIAKTVVEDPQSPVQFAIYPEREFKKEHSNRLNKFVHGHYVTITFRRAALYVDSLLDGTAVIASLPAQEALTDED